MMDLAIERGLKALPDTVAHLLDRARYKATHAGFALVSGPFMRAWHFAVSPSMRQPGSEQLRAISDRFRRLLDRDLENVERGVYPRELLFQVPIAAYLRRVPEGLLDMPRVYWRRFRGQFEDLPQTIEAERYPSYYLRTFHWQTDGWFSDHSARMYDVSVETLFMGTADILRRMMLPPIVQEVQAQARPRIVDLACGTGRLLRQLSMTIPRAKLYGVDLSPNYLRFAHEDLKDLPDLSLLHENAEGTSLQEGSFDVVTCVFFFHEVPKNVRRNVMREAHRILKPGGIFVVNDSAQLIDSAEIRGYLELFPELYHEPYYKGYLNDPLEDAMRETGFSVESSVPHYISKVVVGRKVGDG